MCVITFWEDKAAGIMTKTSNSATEGPLTLQIPLYENLIRINKIAK